MAGAEPLSVTRFYSSSFSADNRYGSWRLNPESTLVANFELGGYDLPTFASVGEAGGGMTRYTHTSKIKLKNGKTVSQFTLDSQNQAGLKSARARGRIGGRPRGLSNEAQRKAVAGAALYKEGKLSVKEIAKNLRVSNSTLYSYLRSQNLHLRLGTRNDETKSTRIT
ncbi:MAG: hypothetical protein KR126chlam2_01092 [Chlamydiae bacterium]|nr:hypothetical protein [Chlamydiota bacterium]